MLSLIHALLWFHHNNNNNSAAQYFRQAGAHRIGQHTAVFVRQIIIMPVLVSHAYCVAPTK